MLRKLWAPATLVSLGMMQAAVAQQAVAPPRAAERVRENREQRIENRIERRAAAVENQQAHKIDNLDHFMASWLAPCNEEEIILAKMAQGRTQNPQVKEFAEQMIADHSKFLQELGKFGHIEHTFKETAANVAPTTEINRANETPAERAADNLPATRPAQDVVRDTVREVGETTREVARDVGDAVRSAVGYTDSADACRMKNEIHRECLALTQQELDKWQGADFDQAYLGQQAGAHIGMLATLRTFERHATNEMRPTIEQAIATTQKHLNHANDLMKNLERPATARRAGERTGAQQ